MKSPALWIFGDLTMIENENIFIDIPNKYVMKSYQEHLNSFLSKTPSHICQQASAIFPIFFHSQISMKLIFLNYWKLKRNIDHLLCRIFLRDIKGQLIHKKCFYVDKIKCYEIDLFGILGSFYPFLGSLEIQFSSPENLVFPFPAVAVVYKGQNFSTFVHAAQRIFTDKNEEHNLISSKIIESGFNIYASDETFPFITFINGPKALENKKITLIAYNSSLRELQKSLTLNCKPYETFYLSLKNWRELSSHLNEGPGCLKMELFNTHTFPRLIVGNYNSKDGSMSVTHSYYDLSQSQNESDYWVSPNNDWHSLTLMLPLKENKRFSTKVYFYPIYSPSTFSIDVEIYDNLGTCLKKAPSFLTISPSSSFQTLSASSLLTDLPNKESLSLRLIAKPHNGSQIPARIKVGFDIKFKDQGFPCNICTNFIPANPSIDKKSSTFRWAPMMPYDQNGSIWCLNDAPKMEYDREALIEYTFYRPQDLKMLSFKKRINPHGFFVIEHTDETKNFFKGKIGWCAIKSDNPYISTYYFSEHNQKMIGGDHGF